MARLLTLHDPVNTLSYYREGHWQQDSFFTLLRSHAAARPDAPFLRDARRQLSYAQALAWVDSIAARLEAAGLQEGDRVCLSLPNRVEAPLVFLACSRNGYVCNPSLHQNFTTDEAITLMQRIRAAAFVGLPGYGVDGARSDRAQRLGEVPSITGVFRVGPDHDPGDLSPEPAGQPLTAVQGPDKIVYLAFTSGTTGMPKAVMHSDNTLLANARPMVADWGHDEGTVLLSLSPLSHHNGWVALGQMLTAGGQLVVNDRPEGVSPYRWILQTGATYVMGVPTHAIDLLAEVRADGATRLGSVRTWYVAGATIPPEVSRSILKLGITPQNVYGMTENSSHQYPLPDDDFETLTATCGRANAGYEVRIFDRDNRDLALGPGEVGEIGGRGACLMLGYFDNQEATERSFNASGWFMTGDLGVLDDRGCLRIVGRSKDMIIRGGHNIHPSRIENLAVTHPAIETAAAFGVADDRLGERVCLAVTFAAGENTDADAVLAHLAGAGLSKYDMPEHFLALTEMPKTASGKILKRELQDRVRQGSLRPTAVRYVAPTG